MDWVGLLDSVSDLVMSLAVLGLIWGYERLRRKTNFHSRKLMVINERLEKLEES